ncbi:MAG: helix-turn-helix domain-containing protein [Acidimicrobiia bacterium]|nr:helix-turn-helix domain-containing protein [Acidimicrobiia bacterium]
MTPAPDNRLLTPNEAAERLNISVAQVYTLLRGNELPGLKIGKRGVWRIDPSQLDEYVERLKTEALDRVRTAREV